MRIAIEGFPLTVDRDIVEPNFSGAVRLLHHIEQAKAIESGAVALMPAGEMADRFFVVNSRGHAAFALIAIRIIGQRPAVNIGSGGEASELLAPGSRISNR